MWTLTLWAKTVEGGRHWGPNKAENEAKGGRRAKEETEINTVSSSYWLKQYNIITWTPTPAHTKRSLILVEAMCTGRFSQQDTQRSGEASKTIPFRQDTAALYLTADCSTIRNSCGFYWDSVEPQALYSPVLRLKKSILKLPKFQ